MIYGILFFGVMQVWLFWLWTVFWKGIKSCLFPPDFKIIDQKVSDQTKIQTSQAHLGMELIAGLILSWKCREKIFKSQSIENRNVTFYASWQDSFLMFPLFYTGSSKLAGLPN
jgi:hypothetical protein